MGNTIRLKASDGFEFDAYRADPDGAARGAIVVIQEIFGVNHHIRSVCDRFAAVGYVAIAPALFDRWQPGYSTGYSPDDVQKAIAFMKTTDRSLFILDVEAAIEAAKAIGPTGIVGYCLGGSLAFLSAVRLEGLSAAVCYYGSLIAANADQTPKCPTQMHFGGTDHSISVADVDTIRRKRPDCEVWLYAGAGHGFSCDERSAFDAEAASIAWMRTAEWFARHLK